MPMRTDNENLFHFAQLLPYETMLTSSGDHR